MTREVVLGLIQMRMSSSVEANLRKAVEKIKEAASKGAQVVCLPELFNSLYFPQEEKANAFSEEIPGKVSEALSKAAKENKVVVVGGSIFERSGGKFFNTSMVFDENGKLLGKYRKMHIPQDDKFFEQNYFAQGDLGFQVFDTRFGKISVLICFDQWFPEAARVCALKGAEIIFYPTAIGRVDGIEQVEGDWREAWTDVQRGHAIANNLVVAGVNRVGREGCIDFWGSSFVSDAFGKIVVRGSEKEEVVIAKVDLSHGKDIREGWRFLHNRRPEAYKKIVEGK